jgi:hypothetical protein
MNALLLLYLILTLATALLLLPSTLRPVLFFYILLIASDGSSPILSDRFLAAGHWVFGGVLCCLSYVCGASVHVYNLNYEYQLCI